MPVRDQAMGGRTYVETFDDGPGGWLGWIGGGGGPVALERTPGSVGTRSPWGVDFNHAPPGAGYLHLLLVLMTSPATARRPALVQAGGANRFVDGGFSRNLTNARLTLRLKGDLERRGARMLLLAQARVAARNVQSNHVLLAQPCEVTPEWSEQTIVLEPDPAQWVPMGVRTEGADCSIYGNAPIAEVLRDVNIDLIFVLFPLHVIPAAPIEGDPHALRAGKDYPVRRDRLPEGEIRLDEVRIEWPRRDRGRPDEPVP